MTRGIRLTGLVALALLAALLVFLSVDDTRAAAPPFDPGGAICFENLESPGECDGDTSAGAATDIRSKFCVGYNSNCTQKDSPVVDSNFGGVVGFTPAEWNLPKGDTIPVGAIAGKLTSDATLGLLNNPCATRISVAFTLMNASINVNDTIAPRPQGETDVMQPLAMDSNGNGLPDGAEKYPSFLAEFFSAGGVPIQPRARLFGISNIQGSWVTLNFLFFEPGVTLEIGQTIVTFKPELGYPSVTILQDPTAQAAPSAITDFCAPLLSANVTLGKTINNPCTPTSVVGANCPVTTDTAPEIKELGYPSLPCDLRSKYDDDGDGKINDGCPQVGATPESGAQCDNDVSDDTEDSDVNDGCPPSGASEGERAGGACSGADEGGCVNRSNPGTGGAYNFTTLALSQRDADGDGIENSLDVCFDKYNPTWEPRNTDPVNDPDADGLPNECDPSPNQTGASSPNGCKSGYTGPDEDQDCFANRADNCPLKVSLQDPNKAPDPATNKPFAPDKDSDGIGDACDPNPDTTNGENIGYCIKFALQVGGAAGVVEGVKDQQLSPDCAAAVSSTNQPITPPPPPSGAPTPRGQTITTGGGGGGGGGGVSGVAGGPAGGVGSLSPTATGFPVWAAVLAGLGAAGIISGLALFTRLAPRRRR